MSKIFNFYANDEDTCWYDSSNVKYSKCIDHDNDLKTLVVVFNNGSRYQYNKVNVNHYLLFREDVSQGKALNKYIKANGYEYEKLDDADLNTIESELSFRSNGGIFVLYDGEKFTMKDGKDNVICEKDVKLTETAFNTICSALEAVGKTLYTSGDGFVEDTENKEEKPF